MDPQQRLFLDATLATTLWQNIDTANVAVAVGIQHMEHAQLCSNQSTCGFSPYVATGSALSVAWALILCFQLWAVSNKCRHRLFCFIVGDPYLHLRSAPRGI